MLQVTKNCQDSKSDSMHGLYGTYLYVFFYSISTLE